MGLRHGGYCIGCFWMLMAPMSAGGAMSVATMAALSVFFLAERLLPGGHWVSWAAGLGLIALGGVMGLEVRIHSHMHKTEAFLSVGHTSV